MGMKISDYLKEDIICLDLKSTSKKDVIEELGSIIKNSKEVTDYEMFISDVMEREKLSTTGVGDGVALPHARTNAVSKFVVAFGRSKKEVNFNSIDKKKVNLIFLMGTPKNETLDLYLVLLAHLTRLLRKEDFRQLLLKAERPSEVIKAFKDIEV
ncbi:MAG: hypothetical protein AUJ85_07370 [Elusimicrobia bacterium CG1_02_37_114]|nr:MAG: hypothetical protein AUJ85_07370 [Elusimicrobia bacterium CG1_02_37_114]PIV53899.1 MAG: PTS sugar transporter subunit IIA [Elusimicrobia bacterium CG02_land_8_20_14_3_00_37_13]PIZ13117.1 MAG: PTS sugar transporter subunit IIA [Elusimicrobia bacterium CG_4_10_14_0_8_um_filter_37_32]